MSAVEEVVGAGRIRRRGVGKYELCLNEEFATTQAIAEAVREGRVLYVEVVLPGGSTAPTTNRPRVGGGEVCVFLPSRLNHVWEGLWLAGKPVLVKVAVVRVA